MTRNNIYAAWWEGNRRRSRKEISSYYPFHKILLGLTSHLSYGINFNVVKKALLCMCMTSLDGDGMTSLLYQFSTVADGN